MLPGGGDGDDSEAEQGQHPVEPARPLQPEEAGDRNGADDVSTWDNADRMIVRNEDTVDLIEGTVGSRWSGHFGWMKVPDAADDEKREGGRNEVLVKVPILCEGEGPKPRDDEHEQIGNGHEWPEGDPLGHFDNVMLDSGSLVDPEVDQKQRSPESIQEEGSYDELFHDVISTGLKKAQPYLVCAFDGEGG